MKILRQIRIKPQLSTLEFTISKEGNVFVLDVIMYGEWLTFRTGNLKNCFEIIRSYL